MKFDFEEFLFKSVRYFVLLAGALVVASVVVGFLVLVNKFLDHI